MTEIKVHMVLLWPATAAFPDFYGDRAANYVTRGQVLGAGSITFHETFTLGVGKEPALATCAFSDEHTDSVDPGRVKLGELHILQGQAGPQCHATAVAGTSMGRGTGKIGPAHPTGG